MITADEVRRLLDYCPVTGIMRWKVSMSSRACAGYVAGRFRKGYISIIIRGRSYEAHRLAWLHVYGEWPRMWIDHINRDPADNRLCNLREVTPGLNQANRTKQKRNTSGFKGVTRRWDGKAWCAAIAKDGKSLHLGHFATPEEAGRAYAEASLRLNGEFARI